MKNILTKDIDIHHVLQKRIYELTSCYFNNYNTDLYNLNSEKLDELIITEDEADYFFHGQDYGKTLGKMLNNKVDTAFIMYNSKYSFIIPDYIKKALEWIKE